MAAIACCARYRRIPPILAAIRERRERRRQRRLWRQVSTISMPDFAERVIRPAAIQLANQIDVDLATLDFEVGRGQEIRITYADFMDTDF